jgi:hypothetical protein
VACSFARKLMNFQEYKTSMKDVYKNFSTLIKQILEKALTDNDFRYQQIQYPMNVIQL